MIRWVSTFWIIHQEIQGNFNFPFMEFYSFFLMKKKIRFRIRNTCIGCLFATKQMLSFLLFLWNFKIRILYRGLKFHYLIFCVSRTHKKLLSIEKKYLNGYAKAIGSLQVNGRFHDFINHDRFVLWLSSFKTVLFHDCSVSWPFSFMTG